MLFRLHDTEEGGSIAIDGKDIKSVGLQTLRMAITVIPQDPSLMEGTFRDNLDPFQQCSDGEVRAALTKATLNPELIFTRVAKGGSNLSAGRSRIRFGSYGTALCVSDRMTPPCTFVALGLCAVLRVEIASRLPLGMQHATWSNTMLPRAVVRLTLSVLLLPSLRPPKVNGNWCALRGPPCTRHRL
jgi:hypothetical protein